MNANICVANLLVMVMLVACNHEEVEARTEKPRHQDYDVHCRSIGNSRAGEYCLTTFTEVLANPILFERKPIMLRGWVRQEGNVIALFPTKDAAEAAELQSSIVILSGAVFDDISLALGSSNNPRALTVGGKFVTRASEGRRSALEYRFGGLDEVDEVRP